MIAYAKQENGRLAAFNVPDDCGVSYERIIQEVKEEVKAPRAMILITAKPEKENELDIAA